MPGEVKLTKVQMYWLREIARPSAESDPFPPLGTLRALYKRGLIEFFHDKGDWFCKATGCALIRATDLGRAALAALNEGESP